jgi:hypothetical protein
MELPLLNYKPIFTGKFLDLGALAEAASFWATPYLF